ncbi:MAG: hypothetical protein JST01_11065 [Cyanobacteria bacterium SZAS TMP-1]|nr:hypothetical protein [Cyanobacteria bacterium SZAS TMP-1]
MKIGWTTYRQYLDFRRSGSPSPPALPPAVILVIVIGLAAAITMFLSGHH